jgi:hypothetical protein
MSRYDELDRAMRVLAAIEDPGESEGAQPL